MKSAGLTSLALAIATRNVASAAPTCSRVTSQWTALFTAECTEWFRSGELGDSTAPTECRQEFTGAVAVDVFPWNDGVVVVDNEIPADDFSLQPAQGVLQYGAGVVVIQTTWDMDDRRVWHARTVNNGENVRAEVEYITNDDQKYVNMDVHVQYIPDPDMAPGQGREEDTRSLSGGYEGAYNFDGNDFVEEVERALQRDPEGDWTIDFFLPADANDETRDRMSSYDFSYSAMFLPSYDLESYEFNYSFELEDLYDFSYSYDVEFYGSYSFDERFFDSEGYSYSYSYSYGYAEDPEAEIADVRSVISLDIYVCADEDNNLEELRFVCDANNGGTAQCYTEAGPANVKALEINGMGMYCESECIGGSDGGLWCNIFGIAGCRMCAPDCSLLCEEDSVRCACISCDRGESSATQAPSSDRSAGDGSAITDAPTSSPSAAPTDGLPITFHTPGPSPSDGSRGIETATPTAELLVGSAAPTQGMPSPSETLSPTEDIPVMFHTPAPMPSTRGLTWAPTLSFETPSPTSRSAGYETPEPTTVDGSRSLETFSPTVGSTGYETFPPTPGDLSRGFETSSPTSGSRGSDTSSPTSGSRGFETSSPTSGSRGFETASPTAGSRGFETASPTHTWGGYDSPSPTTMSRGIETVPPTTGGGSRGFPIMSAAPTSAMDNEPFECSLEDPESCYSMLSTFEHSVLTASGRGVSCEEDCITDGGAWCKAYGLDGCRFCVTSCDEYCATHGLPNDCECFLC